MNHQFFRANRCDVWNLAVEIREPDRLECEALGVVGRQARLDTFQRAILVSRDPSACYVNNRLLCVWGVQPVTALGDTGIPWILTTDQVDKCPRFFARESKKWIERARKEWPILANRVDVRHKKAIQWLEWLGFALDAPQPFGPFNLPFRRFELRS